MTDTPVIAFLLFPNLTQLDLTGPAQVLSRAGARLRYVAASPAPVMSDAGFAILPDAGFDDVPAADVLVVPGGPGVAGAIRDDRLMEWVARVGAGAGRPLALPLFRLILAPSAACRRSRRRRTMKKLTALTLAAGLAALAACNNTPREQAADNIEANAESVADNLEDAADNAGTEAASDNLENAADAVRATGQNQAEDMRTNDADTNLANGM